MRSSVERDDQPLFGPLPSQRAGYKRASPTTLPGGLLKMLWPVPAAMRWAALGFVGGALFWHFVGFWTFMSHIMFSTPEAGRASSMAAITLETNNPQGRGDAIETGSLQRLEKLTAPKVEPSCTAVARDPETGDARQSPCQKLIRPMKIKSGSDRQDVMIPAPIATPELPSLAFDQSLPLAWPPAVSAK